MIGCAFRRPIPADASTCLRAVVLAFSCIVVLLGVPAGYAIWYLHGGQERELMRRIGSIGRA